MDYSKTVSLPRSKFGMKAGLVSKEPQYLKRWEEIDLYNRRQANRKDATAFILHDGPPYANGEIHFGHALNKILKDMILRYKYSRGFRTPYIPGWDCHGLPIELKVTEKLGSRAETMPILDLRQKCRDYAGRFVDKQKEGFKRLGILGDWDHPYLTMSADYEKVILESFVDLVKQGHVYRGLRPVIWSPSTRTALAEAEVEYKDHTSPSIYVKFPVVEHSIDQVVGDLYVMIWTTTPWTLPANTGLSFHPEEDYVAVKVGKDTVILAHKLMEKVLAIKEHKPEVIAKVTKADLEKMKVNHPWIERESRIVFGEHVTMDTGTGIVHTAPGHGMDDYYVGMANGLEMLSPVDDNGRFTLDVPEWKGEYVFKANPQIIEFLDTRGLLYHHEDFVHSYPHDWRSKQPVIFRSKPQWFFKVSDKALADKALSELPKVKWVPEWGQARIQNMLEGRPDWCLSRQRKWGVPIPAFFCTECGEVILNDETSAGVLDQVREYGVDVWYKKDADKLLPAGYKCPKCGATTFTKETDILDVWFDSGVSSLAVIDQREELSRPADVYLEGSDQYRGWFQSSLWPSVALKGAAPFKTVITHGWVLDEEGKQMHKSLGNAVSPAEVFNVYGADVLRLWVVTEDYRSDLRVGDNLIQKTVDAYRKIRNTFKYLLGNLADFEVSQAVPYKDMFDVDKYALSKLAGLQKKVEEFMDNYEYYRAFREVYNFAVIDMSNRYLDILKDRLYIYAPDSLERKSAQTALYFILKHMMMMLAPILSFTMEEVYLDYFAQDESDSVHLQEWPQADPQWINAGLTADMDKIMDARDVVLKALDMVRNAGTIGTSLAAKVFIKVKNAELRTLLEKYKDHLRYFFIVSQVEMQDELSVVTFENEDLSVQAVNADGEKCARCWNFSTRVGENKEHPELCERCHPVVDSLDLTTEEA